MVQRVLDGQDTAPRMAEQDEVVPIEPERLADLLHLVDEAVEVPQRRLVRLIAETGAKLVVVVVLNARRGKVAVARLQVLMGRARPAVQEQHPQAGIVASPLHPHPVPAGRRVHRNHSGPPAQHVLPAGIVQITVHAVFPARFRGTFRRRLPSSLVPRSSVQAAPCPCSSLMTYAPPVPGTRARSGLCQPARSCSRSGQRQSLAGRITAQPGSNGTVYLAPVIARSASVRGPCGPEISPATGAAGAGIRSSRASPDGSHQLARPNRATSAGTSSLRTTTASMRMPAPSPVARIFRSVCGPVDMDRKLSIKIAAALVTRRPVRPRPSVTAWRASPLAS